MRFRLHKPGGQIVVIVDAENLQRTAITPADGEELLSLLTDWLGDAVARREGMIAGLERAVELTQDDPFNFFAVIRAEIERLKA